MIAMAQQAFGQASGLSAVGNRSVAETVGGFAAEAGASAVEQGAMTRQATSIADVITQMGVDGIRNQAERARAERERQTGVSEGGGDAAATLASLNISGGFLVAFAAAMGQVMGKKQDDMMKVSKAINDEGNTKIDPKNVDALTARNSKIQTLSSVLSGLGQEMSSLSNAVNNALKSAGEAQSTFARKS
jgi:hypothetical protein